MKIPNPRRKHYDKREYTTLLTELTKLADTIPTLLPDRNLWDIEGDFQRTNNILFVDAIFQHLFTPFSEFDCRTIKLINLHKPVSRMSFFMTHRYKLHKDAELSTLEKQDRIRFYLEEVENTVEKLKATLATKSWNERNKLLQQIQDFLQQVETWTNVLNNIADYEFSVSNYSRLYYYQTLSYKYWHEGDEEYKNESVHLLNNQRDKSGRISQYRRNIIFVDTHEILREHPYQHKTIEKYLSRFDMVTSLGREQIYVRKRVEIA